MATILGLNVHHADASAVLVRGGRLIAAAEEERFRRVKHWAGFPREAVRYCLAAGGLSLEGVDHVAVNRDTTANWVGRARFVARHRPSPRRLLERLRNLQEVRGVADELRRAFPGSALRARVHGVEHHRAHLASAALVSPFEDCLAVSVDQFGDFASTAWGVARAGRLDFGDSIAFPHSLGTFYSALTQYLGFPAYGDEYKVMGLAPYGSPTYLPALRDVIRSRGDGTFELELAFFRHHRERTYTITPDGVPDVGDLFSPQLERLLGPRRAKGAALEQRHSDLARSVQARYEEVFFTLLRALHARYHLDDLSLAGGCAMNSVANGKITRETPLRRVYVQAAAGDAGGALGAAYVVSSRLGEGAAAARHMDHAYHGPSFSQDDCATALNSRRGDLESQGCAVRLERDERVLCDEVAEAIAGGLVVGWFQGRMEWGPRALGNRSILGDPRRADMKDILNLKIKRRESFRPFAPSVLRSAVSEWFELDDDVPFMEKVLPLREDKRSLVPAVTHVDGSGRLQTVQRETNARFHRLIEAFVARTGVPMLLNTSFNENEPVVCKPEEALDCFLRTRMDLLVLGDHIVQRGPGA